ncbi:hypothetical protein Glove_4g21 [Diversispora epigaea]|uniref:Uncharacterized protein n=1 Tax=Diversispora epigaea TaxID=1348612 RepID=A0A397JPB9_9GLOM|nr:hypothetical protein Glove_4g21 [Diversispora epigaea]
MQQEKVINLEENMQIFEFEYGCQGPSPKVTILEPSDNPNSDQAIFESTKMYKRDLNLSEMEYLDIVGDEAIFRRLIKCQTQWPQLRLLLGQWHTSKDFCSVLIVIFSSYGLLNLAKKLGVRFLDKFEAAVDYRTTSKVLDLLWVAVRVAINIYIKKRNIQLSEIINGKNDKNILLKVWYLYYQWVGIWKAHKIGMRIGNHNLQRDTLVAASPLFPTNIKAAQTERKRIDLFLSEYFDDTSISKSERAINSRREELWELIKELIEIFDMIDPLTHQIFKDLVPPEIHKEGCEKLITCYNNGLERMKIIFKQDVLKIEPRIAQGRHALAILYMSSKLLN